MIFALKNIMEFLHEDRKLIACWTRFIFIQWSSAISNNFSLKIKIKIKLKLKI